MGDIEPYLSLITSEHQAQPDFFAILALILQAQADNIATLDSFPALFDIDFAVGQQLDIVGQWVGITRDLLEPLTGVYFTWDDPALGWGRGVWRGPFDPASGLVVLADPEYRQLLRATILANHWDGSISDLYDILHTLYQILGVPILTEGGVPMIKEDGTPLLTEVGPDYLIGDNGDMSFWLILFSGIAIPPWVAAVILGGYLHIKPAGVRLKIGEPSIPGGPVFGFGADNSSVGGWGNGSWVQELAES